MYNIFLNNFSGKYLNCDFVDGVAQTDNKNVIAYYKRHNMKYEEIISDFTNTENIENNKPKTSKRKTKND
jgi:hypothetical protein